MTVTEMYEKAIEMARDAFSVELNWQTADLNVLEEKIMPVLHNMHGNGSLNQIAAQNLAALYGAYLGELMLREFGTEKGYVWVREEEDGLPYLSGADNKFNPVAKVYKRITDGTGDDIRSFYRVAKAIAEGKFSTT